MQGTLALHRYRGDVLEAHSSGRAVVTTAKGERLCWCGDTTSPVPLLACGHPLQVVSLLACPSLQSRFSEEAIAVAASWNYGESSQDSAIKELATSGGFGEQYLKCGPRGMKHHCAGFHAFLLTAAKYLSLPLSSYCDGEGPLLKILGDEQLRLVRKLRTEVSFVIDECGLPSLSLPLLEIASLYASLSDTVSLPPAQGAAVGRFVAALRTRPEVYGPSTTFEGSLLEATEGDLIVRSSENGLCTAVSFSRGWGISVKADDGNAFTGRTLFLALIDNLGLVPSGRAATLLESRLAVRNGRGDWCGKMKPLVELIRPSNKA